MNRKEFFVNLDWGIDRLRFRYDIEKGQMKDFVIQYETFFGNKWNEVIRYDCSHGFFHRDEMFREIMKNPSLGDKIPDSATVVFLDKDQILTEKKMNGKNNKFVKVRRKFEFV